MRQSTKKRMVTEAAAFFAGMGAGFILAYVWVWPIQLSLMRQTVERVDTFDERWSPLLPQIRTDIIGAPHCVWYACRVV